MKTRWFIGIGVLFVFMLAVTACSFPLFNGSNAIPAQQTEAPAVVQNPPVETQAAILPAVEYELPAGVMVSPRGLEKVMLYEVNGSYIIDIATPGGSDLTPGSVFLAGPLGDSSSQSPLVYRAIGEGGIVLMVNDNGTMVQLRDAENFFELVGAPGQDVLFYVDGRMPAQGYDLFSDCFLGSVGYLTGNNNPIYSSQDSQGFMYQPLAVRMQNGQAVGFLFMRAPWGIGGDIVFRPRNGLYAYDALTGAVSQLLDDSRQVAGISTDLTVVAHTAAGESSNLNLVVQNLETGGTMEFQVSPDHDRGAGNAVFSPDNTFVAWEEAGGWQMAEVPDFKSYLMIGQTNGTLVTTYEGSYFDAFTGTPTWSVYPVGWLDTTRLLVQVNPTDYNLGPFLFVLDPGTNAPPSPFAEGNFAGLAYR